MGQYFRAFMCEENGADPRVYTPYDHHNGYKLMEHAYYHNEFVGAACIQCYEKPLRIWWVGDYAEVGDIPEEKKKYSAVETAWRNDAPVKVCNQSFDFDVKRYLVNLDTHEYINLRQVYEQNQNDPWSPIHPLPLLTAVGNGRGGGDYHGDKVTNVHMVGAWAGDLLQITDEIPKDSLTVYVDVSSDAYFSEQ